MVRNFLHRYARLHVAQLRALGVRVLMLFLVLGGRRAHAASATLSLVFLRSNVQTHPSLEQVVEGTSGPLSELGVELLVAARPSSAELGAMTRAARDLADSTHAIAVVWLGNPPAGQPGSVIYFFDPLRKRLLTRSLAINESEAAAAEEVAVVLRSAVGALQAGADVAMTEVKIPEPTKAPKSPVQPRPARDSARGVGSQSERPAQLGLELGYVGTLVAKGSSWQSGARLALDLQPARSRWLFGAAYQVLPPLRVESSQVTTQLSRHPVEITLGALLFGESFRIEPELAFIADRMLRETERADAPLVATPKAARWLWAVSARIRTRWSLSGRLSVVTTLGADFVLNPFDQVVAEANEQQPLYSLFTVRPLAEAGLALTF